MSMTDARDIYLKCNFLFPYIRFTTILVYNNVGRLHLVYNFQNLEGGRKLNVGFTLLRRH